MVSETEVLHTYRNHPIDNPITKAGIPCWRFICISPKKKADSKIAFLALVIRSNFWYPHPLNKISSKIGDIKTTCVIFSKLGVAMPRGNIDVGKRKNEIYSDTKAVE